MTEIIKIDRDAAVSVYLAVPEEHQPQRQYIRDLIDEAHDDDPVLLEISAYRRSLYEPTPERVERVARAIFESQRGVGLDYGSRLEEDIFLGRARAAIAAMGE